VSADNAVRRFDKKRAGCKTRNVEWVNPLDPEAKVGLTKQGVTDMVYKPEDVSDLDNGAIVQVEVRSGDAADNDASLNQRVLTAVGVLLEVTPKAVVEKVGTTVVADEGYFALEQIDQMQSLGIRTVIADPHARRRRKDLPARARRTLRRAGLRLAQCKPQGPAAEAWRASGTLALRTCWTMSGYGGRRCAARRI
jgi:hypothetical protein